MAAKKNQAGTASASVPSAFRGVPSKGERHGHGHKYAAMPVTPKKPRSK